jgi:hypothetical protein
VLVLGGGIAVGAMFHGLNYCASLRLCFCRLRIAS